VLLLLVDWWDRKPHQEGDGEKGDDDQMWDKRGTNAHKEKRN